MNKEVKDVMKHLRGQGLQIAPAGRGHWAVMDGPKKVYSLPSSPSDPRWLANTKAKLARLGLWDRGISNERPSMGEAPPPLPDFSLFRKEVVMRAGRSVKLDDSSKAAANVLYEDITSHYELRTRKGRTHGHGSSSILTEVLQAYEADGRGVIPSFNYTNKDTNDRHLMAHFAAARVMKMGSGIDVGEGIDQISVESLAYALSAWDWFRDNDYVFPDGRTMRTNGRGLLVEYPNAPVDEIEAVGVLEDDKADYTSLYDLMKDSETTADQLADELVGDLKKAIAEYEDDKRVDEAEMPTPVFSENGVSNERVLLAIEVAAAVAAGYSHDADLAINLARRVAGV